MARPEGRGKEGEREEWQVHQPDKPGGTWRTPKEEEKKASGKSGMYINRTSLAVHGALRSGEEREPTRPGAHSTGRQPVLSSLKQVREPGEQRGSGTVQVLVSGRLGCHGGLASPD